VLVTTVLGWLDEAFQWLVPDRVYDLRDVGFNALAGLVAVAATSALRWARPPGGRGRE
jgi:VanZ family protein